MKRIAITTLSFALILLIAFTVSACTATTDTKAVEKTPETEASIIEEKSDAPLDELSKEALGIAIAWFVGPETDFTRDQFDWKVESIVEDNEGTVWARISATPKDPSMNTEQIYVNRPAGMTLFYPVGREPDVSPSTDDRFPEEVKGKL